MDYGSALTAIESSELEGRGDIIAAIKATVKNTLEEKRGVSGRNAELEQLLVAITEGTGAVGESMTEKAKDAATKLAALTKTLGEKDAALSAIAAEKATLEGNLNGLKRKSTIQEVAAKIGASATVLDRLVADAATIEVIGEDVKIGGTALSDWLESADIKPFAPALFPGARSEARLPKLPSAPASAEDRPTSVYDQVRRNSWKPKGA